MVGREYKLPFPSSSSPLNSKCLSHSNSTNYIYRADVGHSIVLLSGRRVMSADVCTEISSVVISPRISFSLDLDNKQADSDNEAAQRYIDGSSEPDFFFSIISPSNCPHEPCLADEIFSNGKILPAQIKKKTHHQNSAAARINVTVPKKIRLKELLEGEVGDDGDELKPAAAGRGTKFIWQFMRSSSLNFESGREKGLIKSIQFLSRSKSTGSVPNRKQSRISRTSHKQNCSDIKSQFQYYSYGGSTDLSSGQKKPPLGRTKSYGSGNVRINPVLNMPLPPSYFCRGNASLFGFGSLLCSGKDKKSKKKKAVS